MIKEGEKAPSWKMCALLPLKKGFYYLHTRTVDSSELKWHVNTTKESEQFSIGTFFLKEGVRVKLRQ